MFLEDPLFVSLFVICWKIRQYFAGITAVVISSIAIEITTIVFPVERRQRRYFSGKVCLRGYFFDETPLTPLFFQLNAVNAAIFLVKRH